MAVEAGSDGSLPPFMLRSIGAEPDVNLPERLLLYKRPASHARGATESLTDIAAITTPGMSFTLSGPSERLDPTRLPVRGDLAHIRLAGKVFVPHYVVPLPHLVNGSGAAVHSAARNDAEVLATLPTGSVFQVLDVAGTWAWGQAGSEDGGVIGYVPVDALHVAE